MITLLIALFVIGYLAIALEHPLRIDKSASALILGMILWVIYALAGDLIVPIAEGGHLQRFLADNPSLADEPLYKQCLEYILNVKIIESLGDITQTLLFLIGAMTIVELIDVHGGFTVITDRITTRDKRKLLWIICCVTFIFSAILDNMTTTIVMVMLLRKLIADQKERWLFAGMIVIAANTGGAWSPIGDVTTIMLWVRGNVTAEALITYVLLPSIVAMIVPLAIVSATVKGRLEPVTNAMSTSAHVTDKERYTIFILGVGGLIFVPIFKSLTHLPPFVGILLVLGFLWAFIELMYNRKTTLDQSQEYRLARVISRIDMPSILFFLGILMAVSVLQAAGILSMAAQYLNEQVHNVYIIDTLLGALSSIVDNVPLVAGVMGMYPVEAPDAVGYASNFIVNGVFWEYLSYCAGVGGSLLIIGSAAGVIAMGLEKINFGWYLKKFTLLALIGYLAGAGIYVLEVILLK